MTQTRRVAAYARVSEMRSVEKFSLPAQRDIIAAYCQRQGWPEPTYYVEEGKSALSDDYEKRPQFRALLADAEARQFDTILVVDLDRFSRSTVGGLGAASRLERAGCRVVSVQQPGDFTTPEGEMQFTMHLMVARYESRQKGRRVKSAIARMRAEGKHYGSLPFGGRLDEHGHLAIDPATAPLLARILRDVATDSYFAVASALTRAGIPPPSAKRNPVVPHSGHWWPSTLSQIVRAGAWLTAQPEPWPALWLAASGRTRRPRIRGDRAPRMLTGLLRCRCGATLTYGPPSGNPPRRYAQCFSRRLRPGGSGCPHPKTYLDAYEAQVLDQLAALPPPDARRLDLATAPDLAAWRELEEDGRRLREAYRARLYTDAEFATERAGLAAREAALPRVNTPAPAFWAGFGALRAAIPALPPHEQHAALVLLIEHVRVDHRTATVIWHDAVRAACNLPEPGPWPLGEG